MFILNKKTGNVQECHNKDAIKACRKDADNYAVAEKREDLEKATEKPKKESKKAEAGNSSPDTKKTDSGAPDGAQEDKSGEGEKQQAAEDGKQAAGEDAEPDEAALQTMDVTALRKVAKDKGIQGYSNMNKETLIAMILNH